MPILEPIFVLTNFFSKNLVNCIKKFQKALHTKKGFTIVKPLTIEFKVCLHSTKNAKTTIYTNH
jgi:hypothetical protein